MAQWVDVFRCESNYDWLIYKDTKYVGFHCWPSIQILAMLTLETGVKLWGGKRRIFSCLLKNFGAWQYTDLTVFAQLFSESGLK